MGDIGTNFGGELFPQICFGVRYNPAMTPKNRLYNVE
jgi:hypothetical protein